MQSASSICHTNTTESTFIYSYEAHTMNIGPGAGGNNNNHGPGAGGLNGGSGAGAINAGRIGEGVQFERPPCLKKKFERAPTTKDKLRDYFVKWDTNQDGFLSWREISKAFLHLGSFWPAYRAWWALKFADENEDGYVNINDDEFEELIDFVYYHGFTIYNTKNYVQ